MPFFKPYNGHYNYETWLTALWIDNDAFLSDEIREYTKTEDTYTLSEIIQTLIEEGMPEAPPSLYSELLNAALSEVNWQELAENFIDEINEEE